jgi:phage terminase small subunit
MILKTVRVRKREPDGHGLVDGGEYKCPGINNLQRRTNMGQRGPIASFGSVRSERARKRKGKMSSGATPKGSTPERPAWLPADAEAVWDAVVCDLQASGVPLAPIDGHSIALFALTILEVQKAAALGSTKTIARLGRDLIALGNLLGATPASRARMGIRTEPERPENPWRALKGFSSGNVELDAILLQPRISKVKTQ